MLSRKFQPVISGAPWALRIFVLLLTAISSAVMPVAWAAGGAYQIGVLRADGTRSTGSAVQLAPGMLVANCHTLRSFSDIVVLHANRPFRARLERADVRHDLCLLRTARFSAGEPERVASRALRVGDEVSAHGFAPGFRISLARGRITALHRHDGARVIRTSARFPRGASGGALYDARGRLIGVLTFQARNPALNYAVPMEWLERLIDGEGSAGMEPKARAFWEDATVTQPDFLHAARLEYEGDWPGLLEVSRAWYERDPDDAEAWRAQGRARLAQNSPAQARQALEHAAVLAPGSVDVWYWLARTGQALHDETLQAEATANLRLLDADLAADVEAAGAAER